jgi:hypothetical protein
MNIIAKKKLKILFSNNSSLSGDNENFSQMYFSSLFFQIVLLALCQGSFHEQEVPCLLADCPVELDFVKLIENCPLTPGISVKDQNDPIIFGQETLVSIFDKVKYQASKPFSPSNITNIFPHTDSFYQTIFQF